MDAIKKVAQWRRFNRLWFRDAVISPYEKFFLAFGGRLNFRGRNAVCQKTLVGGQDGKMRFVTRFGARELVNGVA